MGCGPSEGTVFEYRDARAHAECICASQALKRIEKEHKDYNAFLKRSGQKTLKQTKIMKEPLSGIILGSWKIDIGEYAAARAHGSNDFTQDSALALTKHELQKYDAVLRARERQRSARIAAEERERSARIAADIGDHNIEMLMDPDFGKGCH